MAKIDVLANGDYAFRAALSNQLLICGNGGAVDAPVQIFGDARWKSKNRNAHWTLERVTEKPNEVWYRIRNKQNGQLLISDPVGLDGKVKVFGPPKEGTSIAADDPRSLWRIVKDTSRQPSFNDPRDWYMIESAGGIRLTVGNEGKANSPLAMMKPIPSNMLTPGVQAPQAWVLETPQTAPTQAGIEARCKLVGETEIGTSKRVNVFEVVITPKVPDGSTSRATTVQILPSEVVSMSTIEGGKVVKTVLWPAKGATLKVPATGRVRFTLTPVTGKLECPLLKVRSDLMGPNQWAIVDPDFDLIVKMSRAKGSDMRSPTGKPALLPDATAEEADSFAKAVRQVMCAAATYTLRADTSGGPVAFGDAESGELAAVQEGEGARAPVYELGEDTPLRRVLRPREESAVSFAEDDESEDGPLAFWSIGGAIKDTYNSAKDTAKDAYDGAKDTAKDAYDGAKDTAKDAYDGAKDVGKEIAKTAEETAKEAAAAGKKAFNTTTAKANELVKAADKAATQPAKDFVRNTISEAKELAIDTRNGLTVIARTATGIYKAAVEDLTDAFDMTVAFFKRVGVVLKQIYEFFASLFDWKDFLETSDALCEAVEKGLKVAPRAMKSACDAFNAQADGLRSMIVDALGPSTKSSSSSKSLDDLDTSPLDYLFDLLSDGLAEITPKIDMPDALTKALSSLSLPRELDTTALADVYGRFLALVEHPDRIVAEGTDLARALAVAVLDLAIQLVETMVAALPKVVEAICTVLKAVFTQRIDIPVVTDFIESTILSGRKLTLLRLVTLLGAIPVTLAYKLATGKREGPFPGGALGLDKPIAFELTEGEKIDARDARTAAVVGMSLDLAVTLTSAFFDAIEEPAIEAIPYENLEVPGQFKLGALDKLRRRGAWFSLFGAACWIADRATAGALEQPQGRDKTLYVGSTVFGGLAVILNIVSLFPPASRLSLLRQAEFLAAVSATGEIAFDITAASYDLASAESRAAKAVAGLDLGVSLSALVQEWLSRVPVKEPKAQAAKVGAKVALYVAEGTFDIGGICEAYNMKIEEWA